MQKSLQQLRPIREPSSFHVIFSISFLTCIGHAATGFPLIHLESCAGAFDIM